eukprot:349957-Chlamydomonas_euryale.AAC.1
MGQERLKGEQDERLMELKKAGERAERAGERGERREVDGPRACAGSLRRQRQRTGAWQHKTQADPTPLDGRARRRDGHDAGTGTTHGRARRRDGHDAGMGTTQGWAQVKSHTRSLKSAAGWAQLCRRMGTTCVAFGLKSKATEEDSKVSNKDIAAEVRIQVFSFRPAVIDTSRILSYSFNLVSPTTCLRMCARRPQVWRHTRKGRPKMSVRWLSALRPRRPDLATRADAINEAEAVDECSESTSSSSSSSSSSDDDSDDNDSGEGRGGSSPRCAEGGGNVGSAGVGSVSVGSVSVGNTGVGNAGVGSASVGNAGVGGARDGGDGGRGGMGACADAAADKKRRRQPDMCDHDTSSHV